MDLFKEFAVDPKRLSAGVWHVFDSTTDRIVESEAEIGEEPAILLASTDNPEYPQLLEKKMKPHIMKRGKDIDRKVREKMINESLVELVILDWRNFVINGEEMKFSKQNAMSILTDPQWVRLKERIMALIGDVDAFKMDREDAIVGN